VLRGWLAGHLTYKDYLIDFYASERHYIDHVAPVWNALDPEDRGRFIVPNELVYSYARAAGVRAVIDEPGRNLTLVASYGDYKKTKGPVVYMEHGIGHSYSNTHPSYAGGSGKDRTILFLCQHKLTAEKNKKAYPNAKVAIIGTPKLDKIKPRGIESNVVAISFHWDCQIAPETRSALPHYRGILKQLQMAKDIELIGHAHPRLSFNRTMQKVYKELKINYVHEFEDVLDLADVYVIDNSSSAYEFAAAGRPVISLNAPWYRKDVDHGIRFWDYIPGPTVDKPAEVLPMIRKVLAHNPYEEQRAAVVKELYPFLGRGAKKAAGEIKKILPPYSMGPR
jgi:hypothetical protein